MAGDGSRLHMRSWERSREPGIEMETRREAPQKQAEDKTIRDSGLPELKPSGAETTRLDTGGDAELI